MLNLTIYQNKLKKDVETNFFVHQCFIINTNYQSIAYSFILITFRNLSLSGLHMGLILAAFCWWPQGENI